MGDRIDNRVIYIDPTNINGREGREYVSPMEDYTLFVDLKIVKSDRFGCGSPSTSISEFSSRNGSISFMEGTNGNLTTNFTDISYTNPDENTKECLGIKTISIDYSSWYVPQITIVFTDVRGASLMSQSEGYNNGTSRQPSFFNDLFSFPYPMFELTVKGLYGESIKYNLALINTNLQFNAENGNFDVRANFVGYMYGVMRDIPMQFLAIAPYVTYNGENYWDKRVESGDYAFMENGVSVPMPSFGKLRYKLAKLALSEEYQNFTKEHNEKEEGDNSELNRIEWLQVNYPCKEFIEPEGKDYLFKIYQKDNVKDPLFIEVNDSDGKTKDIVKNKKINVKRYISIFTDYKNRYYSAIPYDLDFLGKIYKITGTLDKDTKKYAKWEGQILGGVNGGYYTGVSQEKIDEIINKDEVKQLINKSQGFSDIVVIYYEKETTVKIDNLSILNERVEEINNKANEEKEDYNKALNAILAKALGFTPSVKNFYELSFAHMDAFVHLFYSMTEKINSELQNIGASKRENRTLKTYGLTIDDTDLGKVMKEDLMPPFTGIFTLNEDSGMSKREMVWPGVLTGGENIEEVNFINAFLAGAKMYDEDMKKLEQAMKDANYNLNVDISNFIPLTLYDLAHVQDESENPYKGSLEASNGGDCSGEILATFVNRAYAFLMSVSEQYTMGSEAFGKLEAINFYKAYRNDLKNNFSDFYIKYIESPQEGKKKVISEIENDKTAWNISGKSMVKYNNDATSYNWVSDSKGDVKLPVANKRNVAIKSDVTNGRLNSGEYVNLTNAESGNTETCVITEDRSLLKSLLTNISNNFGEFEDIGTSADSWMEGYVKKIIDIDADDYYRSRAIRTLSEEEQEMGKDNSPDGPWRRKQKKAVEENDFSDLYVRYATMMRADIWDVRTLHGHGLYFLQDNITDAEKRVKAKAFLFLMSVPIKGEIVRSVAKNGVELKLRLLREGAIYWREKMMAEKNDDGIIREGRVNGTYLGIKIDKAFSYKKPQKDELYIRDKIAISELFNATRLLDPIKSNERAKYEKYTTPKGLTLARKNYLINFFENWATSSYGEIDELLSDIECYKIDGSVEIYDEGIKNITLDYEHGAYRGKTSRLQTLLRSLFFDADVIIDYSQRRSYGYGVSKNNMEAAIVGFFTQLGTLYKGKVEGTEENDSVMSDFESDNMKLSLYITMKSLYERWFCSTPITKYSFNRGHESNIMKKYGPNDSMFDRFMYLDVFYHNIGDRMMVNLMKADEMLGQCIPSSDMEVDKQASQSLQNYLTRVAEQCGANFLSLPILYGTRNRESFRKMFTANPNIRNSGEDSSTFLVLYKYRTSNHLNNGIDYRDDGFVFDGDVMIPSLADEGENIIPAFAVTYAKQNQSFFKSIMLNTNQPPISDYTIEAEQKIAAKGSETPRETNLVGQDIYQIYSNASFECTVEMMGNAQVFPCMYFQLNGVPMWKGAYYITKVVHEITAGNMTTTFTGIKMSRNSIPMAEMETSTDKNTGVSTESYTSVFTGGSDFTGVASTNYGKALNKVLFYEGGYKENDKDDNDGGCTNKGITLKTFRGSYGDDKTCKDLRNITNEQVAAIYKKRFWDKMRGDEIKSPSIAGIIFDFIVNSGTGKIESINKLLGIYNSKSMTDESIEKINNYNTQEELFNKIWTYRYNFYHALVKEKPNKKKYLKGWLNRLNGYIFEG